MNNPIHSRILPWFPFGTGLLGLGLRLWLFSATDEKGLLPAAHPAATALYLLTALTLGILFLAARAWMPRDISGRFHQFSGAAAYLLAALGLFATAFFPGFAPHARLGWLATAASGAGGLSMAAMALLTFGRKPLPYWLPGSLTIVLMLVTVAQCQVWGSVPQVQLYFFPLFACVFLILSAYHKTVFTARKDGSKALVFFSQGALYFCCLSLNTPQWPFYLGMLSWAAVQFYPCILTKKEP